MSQSRRVNIHKIRQALRVVWQVRGFNTMTNNNLDKLIDDVRRNPQSDDALLSLINGLPEASQDTLRAIVKSVIAEKESN